MKKSKQLIFWVGIWLMFSILGAKIIDADWWWHLRLGQIISVSGIPRTDPLSYTMPSYPFVDFEWGLNVIWYWGYRTIGWVGLTGIWAVIPILTIWLIKPRGNVNFGWVLGSILTWSVMISRYGVRPQVVTWWGLAIILRWVTNEQRWIRERKWLPLIMLVWANLHPGFAIGLIILGIWIIGKTGWKYWLTGLTVTLINPYGIGLWSEIVRQQFQAVSLNPQYISEWGRWWTRPDIGLALLGVMGYGLWVRQKNKNNQEALILTVLFLMALSALRHTPLFMIAATAMVGKWWPELEIWLMAYGKMAKKRLEVAKKWLMGIATTILLFEVGGELYRSKDYENRNYPTGAVEFLKVNGVKRNLFNWYGWGGYLGWRLPKIKVFIDGRMSNWYWEAPKSESGQAFGDYLLVKRGVQTDEIFKKYSINTIVWPTEENIVLDRSKWKLVYKDKVGMVLISNDN